MENEIMNRDYYFYEKIKEEYDVLDTLVGNVDIPAQSFYRNNLSESEDYIKNLKERLDVRLGLQLISYLEDKQTEDLRIVFMESNKFNRDTNRTTFYKEIIIYKRKPETRTKTLSWAEMNSKNIYPNKIER